MQRDSGMYNVFLYIYNIIYIHAERVYRVEKRGMCNVFIYIIYIYIHMQISGLRPCRRPLEKQETGKLDKGICCASRMRCISAAFA